MRLSKTKKLNMRLSKTVSLKMRLSKSEKSLKRCEVCQTDITNSVLIFVGFRNPISSSELESIRPRKFTNFCGNPTKICEFLVETLQKFVNFCNIGWRNHDKRWRAISKNRHVAYSTSFFLEQAQLYKFYSPKKKPGVIGGAKDRFLFKTPDYENK